MVFPLKKVPDLRSLVQQFAHMINIFVAILVHLLLK